MKKSLPFFFLLLPVAAFAQQWRPVIATDKYNYRIDTAGFITTVISIDSSGIENSDSVFYLNRIVTACPGIPDPGIKLFNQPQFLNRNMISRTGGVYLFFDPGKFWLHSLAGVNDSWVFDSVANITAQVTSIMPEPVFGQQDSVKTISLSNGGLIKLSKNHGIIRFPRIGTGQSWILDGIAGRDLGVLIPGFREIFDFKTGDVFQYSSYGMNYGVGYGSSSFFKKTILSKDSSASGYSYEVLVTGMAWPVDLIGIPGDTSHFSYVEQDVYTDSLTHPCNLNPHELVLHPWDGAPEWDIAGIMKIYPDTGQTISRLIGLDMNYPTDEVPMYQCVAGDTLLSAGFFLFDNKFMTGLGRVRKESGIFEAVYKEDLIGYVKNGDTTGIVYPDDFLLQQLQDKNPDDMVVIFPNPAYDKVCIRLPRSMEGEVRAELYSLDGRCLLTRTFSSSANLIVLDVQDLPKAIYLLSVCTGQVSVCKKLTLR